MAKYLGNGRRDESSPRSASRSPQPDMQSLITGTLRWFLKSEQRQYRVNDGTRGIAFASL